MTTLTDCMAEQLTVAEWGALREQLRKLKEQRDALLSPVAHRVSADDELGEKIKNLEHFLSEESHLTPYQRNMYKQYDEALKAVDDELVNNDHGADVFNAWQHLRHVLSRTKAKSRFINGAD